VNASAESSSHVARDRNTGKEKWRTKGLTQSWNTPALVKVANGATEIALAARQGDTYRMLGFDPDTGNELWHADTYNWYICPSLVAHDGMLYGLQHSINVAVKAGGRGDVTKSHVVWKGKTGHVVSSPLYH